jgi:SAM-dependent methyltransferase
MGKDFFWLHLRDLPYFRAMLRSVEAYYFQDYEFTTPVLDVGCGDGHFASLVFDEPIDIGIDPWAGPIQQAAHLSGYRHLVQTEGANIPFPDEHFGSALSNSVLEHIPQVQDVLAEVARVLKPNACFLFSVPNERYLSELSVASKFRRIKLSQLANAYTNWFKRMSRVHHADQPEVWISWLNEAGFSIEKWWHYFSPQAMRVMEWGHYFGAPTLLPHLIAKRWIIAPTNWNLALTDKLIRPYANPAPAKDGTFTFYVARKC